MSRRPHPPTVRLRRLTKELLRMRTDAKLTREEVTQKTGINGVTLYRVETGRARPQRRTLVGLLDLYDVPQPRRGELLEIAAGAEHPGWLRQHQAELPEVYTAFISFESEARSERNYESLFLPGLLQTEEYARAVIKGILTWASPQEVEQRVQVRMARQVVLSTDRAVLSARQAVFTKDKNKDKPLQLWAIVDEAALSRRVGGREVMRNQTKRLLEAAEDPHITIQVIPFDTGAHPGMPGSFIHLDFPDAVDADLVHVDSMAGDLFLEAAADIRRYTLIFEHLRALALSPDDSARIIAGYAANGSE